MGETLHQTPDLNSPERFDQPTVPPQAQRIYDTVRDYHDTIQAASGEDISELDAEADAWMAAEDIAGQVERNPEVPITGHQHDLLAAMEAHAATFKATASFSAEQNAAIDKLDTVSVSGIVQELMRERHARFMATTEPEEKTKLWREKSELSEYADMLASDEAKFDVAHIDRAVDAYKAGGIDDSLNTQSQMDTKANAYFAKYAGEVVSKVQPAPAESTSRPTRNTEQQQVVEETRSKVEIDRNAELFDDIVRIGKNRTQLNMDVEGGFQFIGDGPKTEIKNLVIPEHIRKEAEQNPDWRLHLNEAVMFSDLTEPLTQQVTKTRQVKGRFGQVRAEPYQTTEEIPGSGRLSRSPYNQHAVSSGKA